MADINIFALGGQDENGKNSLVIENNNDIYVVNAGLKVPINNLNGIDGIIPDFSYLKKRKGRVKGIFITHAHDEVFAAIPWLVMDLEGVTIYASKYTAEVISERISKYKIGHNNYKIEIIKENQKIGSLNIKTFSVANSIPGSLSYNFQTEDGDILVMGNNVIEDLGPFGHTDLEKIKSESNEILAVILDSRIANYKGHSYEKKSVIPSIKDFFDKAGKDQRIIVGAYDEEVYSIDEVIKLAQKEGRPIVSYGRAFDNLYSKIKKVYKLNLPDFEDYKKANKIDNAVILVTGTWSRLYQRFVRIALGNDVFMKFKENDNIIMIAPPINGMEVIYADSLDEVARIAPNILDVSDKDFYKLRSAQEDIRTILKTFKPKYFLPTGGLYRYLVVATKIAIETGITQDRNIVLQNGKIGHFQNGKLASQKAKIKEYGDVIIDGFGVGDVSYEVIRERQTLATGGLVSISMQLDRRTKKPLGEMNIQILGLITKSQLKVTHDAIHSIVLQKINEANNFDYREIQNQIRKRTRKVIQKMYDKEPLVIITFYEV
ncbi:MAG: ribonuclease J [Mycoplasmatales bacterium]|nr:ribonuclease J [Mycoplasmatales bacterium]